MAQAAAVVLFSAEPERTVAFYRAMGIGLEDEDHGDGNVHAAADLGDVHIAVFPAAGEGVAPGWRHGGSTFTGFVVDSLDQTLVALNGIGAKVLVHHQVREWGCRAVVEDPDGRAVEISQRDHCDGPEGEEEAD